MCRMCELIRLPGGAAPPPSPHGRGGHNRRRPGRVLPRGVAAWRQRRATPMRDAVLRRLTGSPFPLLSGGGSTQLLRCRDDRLRRPLVSPMTGGKRHRHGRSVAKFVDGERLGKSSGRLGYIPAGGSRPVHRALYNKSAIVHHYRTILRKPREGASPVTAAFFMLGAGAAWVKRRLGMGLSTSRVNLAHE